MSLQYSTIFEMSILKTIRFNYYYVYKKNKSIKQFLRFPFIIGKNVLLMDLSGEVILKDDFDGHIGIGFGRISIFDRKREKSIWNNRGAIYFLGNAHLGHGTRINNLGRIVFGERFGISANTTIDCNKEIVFGDDCLLSWDILIMDSDTHKVINMKTNKRINEDRSIYLGNHVWVGCRSTILKGSRISDNTVIAAGSVLADSVEENNVVIGSRGHIIKKDIDWMV